MENIKYSVLLPIYNKEQPKYFNLSIKSIVEQTIFPDEIVIVKDGKLTQELDKVINKYQKRYPNKFKIVCLEENKGLGIALKNGINNCKNEYVARMDSDDYSVPNRMEQQIKYLETNKDVDIIGGYIEEYDENMENLISKRIVPIEDKDIKKEMVKRCAFNHSTVMYKKSKIIEVGNYSNKRTMEDYDLWIRCTKKGYKMHNLPMVLTKNRTGDNMYKKRAGKKYIKTIIEIENLLYSLNMINIFQKWYNIIVRAIVAIVPAKIRKIIYIKILRRNKEI